MNSTRHESNTADVRENEERHRRETRTICILEKWVRTGRLRSLWTGSTEGPSLTRLVSTWRAETIDGTANRCRLWYCHQTSRSRQNTRTPWRDFLNFKLREEQTQHHMTEEADGGFMRTCWVFSLLCTSSPCPRWGPAITACCALSFTFGSAVLLNAISLQTGSLSPPARWRSPENRAPSPRVLFLFYRISRRIRAAAWTHVCGLKLQSSHRTWCVKVFIMRQQRTRMC